MVRAAVILLLLCLNVVLWGVPVALGGLGKLLTFGAARRRVVLAQAWLAERWVQGNDQIFDWMVSTEWEIDAIDELDIKGRYLVIANHLSWIDIFALFRAFHGRTAFIRFFLKRALIWSPIIGQATWALDFPFMRRYSSAYLAAHPEKRGKDLETTRKACRRYRTIPCTLLNFLEGTRFTREKQEDQQSPYRHLLRPRIGGVGFAIASMGAHLDALIDATLVYPGVDDPTMFDFMRNRIPRVVVRARRLEIPPAFRSAAITQPGPERDRFKEWIESIWREKDELIDAIEAESPRIASAVAGRAPRSAQRPA